MQNVTLRMDEELLTEFKHRAVDARMSLSAWITTTLKTLIETPCEHDAIQKAALHRMNKGFHLGGKRVSREDLHER
jgi:hypothetical protein